LRHLLPSRTGRSATRGSCRTAVRGHVPGNSAEHHRCSVP
jgi:hypothetical protein